MVEDDPFAEFDILEVLDPPTLRALRRSAGEDLYALVGELRRRRRIEVVVDPATRDELAEAATGWGEAPDDTELHPAARAAAVQVSRDATDHGYLWGRLLVGTADIPRLWSGALDSDGHPWPDNEPPDLAAQEELEGHAAWLSDTVRSVDFAGISTPLDGHLVVGDALDDILHELVAGAGHPGHAELTKLADVAFGNAIATALVESNACPPPVSYTELDPSALGPAFEGQSPITRFWMIGALGALLAVADHEGNATEADLRDVAEALGGEAGHQAFRQLRRAGVVDYKLSRNGTGHVRIPDHALLRRA